MTKKNKKPELVNVSLKELDDIKSRVSETHLGNDDKKIILSILTTYQWLHAQLQTAKFSLHRLKKMFGFTTEKRSAAKKNNSQDVLDFNLEQDGSLLLPDTTQNSTESARKK